MPIKETKEGVCISSDRKIPSTAATQFPDNASKPFWSFKEDSSASDDFFDCYVSFKEFNCHEYVWDWQDRKLDELLVKKLVRHYNDFFRKKQIGKNCFITFKVSNNNPLETLGRLYMSVISSNGFAIGQDMFNPPLFEVVHSATSSNEMIRFAKLYNESVGIASEKFRQECGPKVLSIIPTHQFEKKSNWYTALNSYFSNYQSSFRCKVDYFRPLIPRATIADSLGFVGAVLATKRALSNYSVFSGIAGITAYPIVDAGPLLFRGGLDPSRLREFVATYPGARTVTITSAFRYDNGIGSVKSSIDILNRVLPKNQTVTYTRAEQEKIAAIEGVFAKHYRGAVNKLPSLKDIAEGMQPIGRSVPKSLKRSFSLYSLGIPPEILGTGNAIVDCIKQGLVKDLERFYPNIKQDLIAAGSLLNKENLNFLAKTHKAWASVQAEVKLVEDYTDASLGPNSTDAFLHRNHTSNVFHLWSTKKDFSKDLFAAARLRRCMG
ncbi:TPA: phosphoenolpyruvate carboxylase [Candidatus Woesearchaeota archaeon]|nr:phosphoenolpyruvate carboxylase [Candidatus Woesearchaeota archaeon]